MKEQKINYESPETVIVELMTEVAILNGSAAPGGPEF